MGMRNRNFSPETQTAKEPAQTSTGSVVINLLPETKMELRLRVVTEGTNVQRWVEALIQRELDEPSLTTLIASSHESGPDQIFVRLSPDTKMKLKIEVIKKNTTIQDWVASRIENALGINRAC